MTPDTPIASVDLDELDRALRLVWYSRGYDPSGPSYSAQEKGLAAVGALVRSAPALLAAARKLREVEAAAGFVAMTANQNHWHKTALAAERQVEQLRQLAIQGEGVAVLVRADWVERDGMTSRFLAPTTYQAAKEFLARFDAVMGAIPVERTAESCPLCRLNPHSLTCMYDPTNDPLDPSVPAELAGEAERMVKTLEANPQLRAKVLDGLEGYYEAQTRTIDQLQSALARAEGRVGELEEALGLSTPWPVQEVLLQLSEAARVLLQEKGYDGHGWEMIRHAALAAHNIRRALRSQPPLASPVATAEGKEDSGRHQGTPVSKDNPGSTPLSCAVKEETTPSSATAPAAGNVEESRDVPERNRVVGPDAGRACTCYDDGVGPVTPPDCPSHGTKRREDGRLIELADCSEAGCGMYARVAGLCLAHYQQKERDRALFSTVEDIEARNAKIAAPPVEPKPDDLLGIAANFLARLGPDEPGSAEMHMRATGAVIAYLRALEAQSGAKGG
jgi:hypothetical protein